MNETTFLDVDHRDRLWRSSLSGATYRWDEVEGWQVETKVADFHPVRPGVMSASVYARSSEKFEELV